MLIPILEHADERAESAAARLDEFKQEAASRGPARPFAAVLAPPGLSIVAEIKRRSPSAGDIDAGLDPVAQAVEYQAGGADAISVLTEPEFFGGSLDDLRAVREAVDVPVLRKDFTRNQAQIWEARAAGADAVLLIVATLTQPVLEELFAATVEIGIDAIVEVHSAEELGRAGEVGATIVGVNNRDLTTFATDLSVAESLAPALPEGVLAIGESGVSTIEGAARMRACGYDAILVGEALVRSSDPAAFVSALKGAS
jgi:indole-3-glycerol phosphate synthase